MLNATDPPETLPPPYASAPPSTALSHVSTATFSSAPSMVRPGKERMSLSAPGDDEATQMTTQDARWLNGVNRQLQADAAEQRLAASQAAAMKRKVDAMPEDERKRRDAERNRINRARQAAERVAAAAAARAEACPPPDNEALRCPS